MKEDQKLCLNFNIRKLLLITRFWHTDVIDRLKSLDDTMFRLYDDISNGIKGVDLKVLDDLVDPMMQHRERYKAYIQNG